MASSLGQRSSGCSRAHSAGCGQQSALPFKPRQLQPRLALRLALSCCSGVAIWRPFVPSSRLPSWRRSSHREIRRHVGTSAAVRASSRSGDRRTGPDALRLFTAGGIVLWIVVCITLVGAATIYPVLATSARTNNFTSARSLDGTAYMSADPANQGDAQAIAWLNAHVAGDPVIVEGAQYLEYTHYGRISAFTGLPTLMGWGGHEYQWRFNWLQQPGRGDVIGAAAECCHPDLYRCQRATGVGVAPSVFGALCLCWRSGAPVVSNSKSGTFCDISPRGVSHHRCDYLCGSITGS